MKLLIKEVSPASVTAYPVRSKSSPQHPDHKQLSFSGAGRLVYFSVKRNETTSPRLMSYVK
jgi:hypothetical protein